VRLRIGSDRVGAERMQLLQRVGGVPGEHHVATRVIHTDDRDVAGSVSGGVDGDDSSIVSRVRDVLV
jgi:hypothetical protein